MQIEWNNCFLCLNDLTGQVSREKEGGRGKEKRKKETTGINREACNNLKAKTELLFNYLLTEKLNKHSGVISDIKQLLESVGDGGSGVKFCDKCEGQLRRVAALHRELEVVQMKLVSVLKAVKQTVVQNSRKGGGGENVGLEIFEQWLREQESNYAGGEEGNEEKKSRLKEERRILATLEAFQDAVIENDKISTDIPLVFLERCTVFRTPPSEQLLHLPAVTVKAEMPDLEDFLDTPISDYGEQLSNLTPETEAPKPKRKHKKRFRSTDIEIKREVLRPPRASTSTARLKMIEMSNSYKQKKKEPPPPTDKILPPPRKYFGIPPSFQPKPHSKLKSVAPRKLKHLYCCALCPFTIVYSLYGMEEHLQNHEAEVAAQENPPALQFQCDQCPSKFRVEQAYEFHMLGHTGHYLILCEPCNTWQPPGAFKDHLKSHLEKTFPCPNCSFCCTTRDKYIRHLFENHLTTSILECDICGVRSSGKQKFLEHYNQVHQAIEKLVCGVEGCSKEFLNPAVLKSHRNVHTDRFKCSHCDRRFESQLGLNEHMKAVKGEKSWQCDQCQNWFFSKDSLERHKVRVHDATKFKCDLCDKEFNEPGQLTIHRRLHTGQGFTCEHPGCGKVYATKYRRKQHMIFHSTERNFICDLCGAALKSRQQFKRHKLTHAGEAAKKYKCPECGKRFLFDKYLVNHLKVHKGDRPYICEACGKGFNQSATLHNHKKKCFLGSAPPVIQKRDERAKPIKIKLSPTDDIS